MERGRQIRERVRAVQQSSVLEPFHVEGLVLLRTKTLNRSLYHGLATPDGEHVDRDGPLPEVGVALDRSSTVRG